MANNCSISNGVNINAANANEWIPFTDEEGRAIAEINANGNILGTTALSFYINGGAVRQQNGFSYLDRSISIRSANQPASPVSIRLYIRNVEFENLKTALGGNLALTDLGLFINDDGCVANLMAPALPVASTPGSWATDYIFSTSTMDLKTFYFAKANSVLPVKILSFNAEKQPASNKLSWKANCTSGADFTLEKSNDGQQFLPITTLSLTSLDCNQLNNYNDYTITTGRVYYRLKVMENGGAAQYSKIVVIDRNSLDHSSLNVVPNPVTDNLAKLQLQSAIAGNALVIVTDVAGKRLLSQSFNVATGAQVLQINIASLANGIYYVAYLNGKEKLVARLLKN